MLRTYHERTQTDVARRLGVTKSHLNHLESAQRARDVPSLALVRRTAWTFATSTDWLLRADWPKNELLTSKIVDQRVSPHSPASPRLLGAKVRFLREHRHLLQRQVAAELGLANHAAISNVERGRKRVSLRLLIALAEHFGTTTDWLLDDDQPVE